MEFSYPKKMVGRETEWARLTEFAAGRGNHATLGIAWGRRRVGTSFLLQSLVEATGGFYYEAIRGSSGEALRELGERIGQDQNVSAPLALGDWNAALNVLLALGADRGRVVVLDEYPYLLEHSPQLDSIIQRALGPGGRAGASNRARLVLCGSAISVMSRILAGTAPLRGRAGLDLRISSFDFRVARQLHGIRDLATAFRCWTVIGGVAAYAREMVDGDLPSGPSDFDRWVCRRVLSPATPLFNEVGMLLSEDPSTSKARKVNLYHAALAGIATGHHAHGKLAGYVKIPGASLAPIVDVLVSSGFAERIQDPIRGNRPTTHPADPLIRFHYAVIRRYQSRLSRYGTDTQRVWRHALPTFQSQVLGPCFEAAARYWTTHFADPETIGGEPDHVGPTTLTASDGTEVQLDVVVASGDVSAPSERTVRCLGEAKAGERISRRHLQRLQAAREALGHRAKDAKLLLFGLEFSPGVCSSAQSREDLELVDLQRLYEGR